MHSVFYSIFPSARSLGFPEGCWTGRVARCSVASMLSVIVSLVQPVALTRVRAVLCAPAWWGIVPRVPKRALSGQRGSRLLRPAWAILFAMFILPLALCHVRRPVSWRVSRRSYLEPLSGLDVLWGPFLRWRLHEEQLWSGVAAHAGLGRVFCLEGTKPGSERTAWVPAPRLVGTREAPQCACRELTARACRSWLHDGSKTLYL